MTGIEYEDVDQLRLAIEEQLKIVVELNENRDATRHTRMRLYDVEDSLTAARDALEDIIDRRFFDHPQYAARLEAELNL